ncbi:uncharacterized protein C8R40DRAFT_1101238 [Lentinula edodes]|uniref:uncharacterized protein n=1 Tax=Lentinula edodes TaxID=5353 RepID=UPI001E8D04C2|nr:uncharacterized protein C8R40DRAFT_1101238 [Lentinula edodes]KAH7875782.1 hypothetical protein C8R40DRAFT_1101238 [Lentinula edodes]
MHTSTPTDNWEDEQMITQGDEEEDELAIQSRGPVIQDPERPSPDDVEDEPMIPGSSDEEDKDRLAIQHGVSGTQGHTTPSQGSSSEDKSLSPILASLLKLVGETSTWSPNLSNFDEKLIDTWINEDMFTDEIQSPTGKKGLHEDEPDSKVKAFAPFTDLPRQHSKILDFPSLDSSRRLLLHYESYASCQPFTKDKSTLEDIEAIISKVHQTASTDGCEFGLGARSKPFPIFEVEYSDFNSSLLFPKARKQRIFHNQHILIHNAPCPDSSELKFDPLTFSEHLGSVSELRMLHGQCHFIGGVGAEKGCQQGSFLGTLSDVILATQNPRGEILNCLDLPLSPDHFPPPRGLSTDSAVRQRLNGYFTHCKQWGLAATAYATHKGHVDVSGYATYVRVLVGKKYWIVGYPRTPGGFGSIDSFRQGYEADLSNSQQWAIHSVILEPGDIFIMSPCTPHFVLTLEPTICQGGHFYCCQTMEATGSYLFQTFITANWLTNKPDGPSRQNLHIIIEGWAQSILTMPKNYLELVEKANQSESRVIHHLPNFTLFDDIHGFFMLWSIALFGPVLDYRLYVDKEAHMQDWVFDNYDLVSTSPASAQCKALLVHKVQALKRGISEELGSITAKKIRNTITYYLEEFMEGWDQDPKNLTYALKPHADGLEYIIQRKL